MAEYYKGLTDQHGRKIPRARLTEEIAGPSLSSVRSPISGHPAEGLTPSRLAAIHRQAANGDPLAYLELAEDIEERDLHYLAVLSTRRRQVAQLPIIVEAASDDADHVRHADFVREWLQEGLLDLAMFDIFDAIGKGFSIHEIIWDTSPDGIVPAELRYRPQRWFTFDTEDGETLLLHDGGQLRELPPHKFVIHRHPSKSGLTIRSGLARVASWAWMYKAFTLRDWAIFVQNYGQPIRLGRYDPSATEADKEVLWRAVANIAGDCAAIVPRGMEMEFVSLDGAASTSDQLYESRADWMDRQISKLVLGQTTTTDAVSGGHAVAKEHRLVQEDIERSDARLGSATVTRQLVHSMVAFNFGPQRFYPRARIGHQDETPIDQWVDPLAKLVPLGLRIEASQVRDRLGFSDPAPDAEVLGRPAASAPAGGPAPADVSRHSAAPAADPRGEHVEDLVLRTTREAGPVVDAMIGRIRAELDQAVDLQDALARLDALELGEAEFAQAMTEAMALAHLAGEAALVDEVEDEDREAAAGLRRRREGT